MEDGLPSYTEAHQDHQHDDHKVQHVDHLEDGQTKDVVFMNALLHRLYDWWFQRFQRENVEPQMFSEQQQLLKVLNWTTFQREH